MILYSSEKYPCKRSKLHSLKRQDKFETNQKIKQKQKEQRLGIHEFPYKTEMELDAHVLCATTVVESFNSNPGQSQF